MSAPEVPPPRPALAGVDVGGAPEAWTAAGFAVTGGVLVAGGIPVRPLGGGAGSLVLAAGRGDRWRPVASGGEGRPAGDLDGLPVEWASGLERGTGASNGGTADPGGGAADPGGGAADPGGGAADRAGGTADRAGGIADPGAGSEGALRNPNGVVAVDMAIVLTGSRERTGAALAAAGLPFGRLLEGEVPGGGLARRGFLRFANGPILEVVEPAGAPPGPARLWGIQFVVEDLDRAAAAMGPLLGEPHDAVQPGRRIATVRREADLGIATALITPEPARGGT